MDAERFLPAVDELQRFDAMIFEQAGEAFARAARVAGEHDLVAAPAQLADVLGDGFVDVRLLRALGREVARRLHAEIDDAVGFGLGEGRGEVDRPLGFDALPLFLARNRARRGSSGR